MPSLTDKPALTNMMFQDNQGKWKVRHWKFNPKTSSHDMWETDAPASSIRKERKSLLWTPPTPTPKEKLAELIKGGI